MNPYEGKFWVWQNGPNTYMAFDQENPVCDCCGGPLMEIEAMFSGSPAEICQRLGPNASVRFFAARGRENDNITTGTIH